MLNTIDNIVKKKVNYYIQLYLKRVKKNMKIHIGIEVEGTIIGKSGEYIPADQILTSQSPNKRTEFRSGVGWGTDGASRTAEFRGEPYPIENAPEKITKEFSLYLKDLANKGVDVWAIPYAQNGSNGMHITIDRFFGAAETIKLLDMFVALPLAAVEHQSRFLRYSQDYGFLGSTRRKYKRDVRGTGSSRYLPREFQPVGDLDQTELIEYRTLSSQWACFPEMLELVLSAVTEIVRTTQTEKMGLALFEATAPIYSRAKRAYTNRDRRALHAVLKELEALLPPEMVRVRGLFKLYKQRGIKSIMGRVPAQLGWHNETPVVIPEPVVVAPPPLDSDHLYFAFVTDLHMEGPESAARAAIKQTLEAQGMHELSTFDRELHPHLLQFRTLTDVENWLTYNPLPGHGAGKLLVIRGADSKTQYKTSFPVPAPMRLSTSHAYVTNLRRVMNSTHATAIEIIGLPTEARKNPTAGVVKKVELLAREAVAGLHQRSQRYVADRATVRTEERPIFKLPTKAEIKKVKEVIAKCAA
jgi:hypothetical protein